MESNIIIAEIFFLSRKNGRNRERELKAAGRTCYDAIECMAVRSETKKGNVHMEMCV